LLPRSPGSRGRSGCGWFAPTQPSSGGGSRQPGRRLRAVLGTARWLPQDGGRGAAARVGAGWPGRPTSGCRPAGFGLHPLASQGSFFSWVGALRSAGRCRSGCTRRSCGSGPAQATPHHRHRLRQAGGQPPHLPNTGRPPALAPRRSRHTGPSGTRSEGAIGGLTVRCSGSSQLSKVGQVLRGWASSPDAVA
jgi:hypothetical protein